MTPEAAASLARAIYLSASTARCHACQVRRASFSVLRFERRLDRAFAHLPFPSSASRRSTILRLSVCPPAGLLLLNRIQMDGCGRGRGCGRAGSWKTNAAVGRAAQRHRARVCVCAHRYLQAPRCAMVPQALSREPARRDGGPNGVTRPYDSAPAMEAITICGRMGAVCVQRLYAHHHRSRHTADRARASPACHIQYRTASWRLLATCSARLSSEVRFAPAPSRAPEVPGCGIEMGGPGCA
ncbi:hypothetical protein PYCCODRAFT_775731 [Trametes coccinea BRFM310]|uniref:Uncharacterized protein n=1 Tax=Trametes coccinea (strain BRFM310) TaxID=1353009 RepID=A0A1Y2J0F7_TRAC3|nr:hypothetical protein PYCCODRAFT_775731 [Trametes coccinea BRFM310]